MASTTLFKQFNIPIENKSLIVTTKEIIDGKYKNEVELVRSAIQRGNKEEADRLKKQLLAFTPSATFSGGRKMDHFVSYSQFIILDIDKLTPEQLQPAFDKAISIPYTFSCFRSPSGNGIKILVQVNTGLPEHKRAYQQVADYYEEQLSLPIDPSGKDVTRLCFVSYDPQAYKNINSQIFTVSPVTGELKVAPEIIKAKPVEVNNDEYAASFQKCIDLTNKKSEFKDGNRNNYIHLLACNCNRIGISETIASSYILQNFDLDPKEAKQSIESAYKNNTHEFAKFANSANLQTKKNEKAPEDFLKTTPTIPTELYSKMPFILKEGSAVFTEERERDVFLTGALAILSGCLPKVKGIYDRQEVFPNLFSFAIAPAASGKGALIFAKMLADEYHTTILKKSKESDKQYKQELSEHKQKINAKKKGDTSTEEEPAMPAFKVLYIPANTSYAKILFHLEQNDGSGIICETEADTLAIAFKKDWGGYSDMLRKSFHHEKLSSSKKTNDEYIEVNNPRLSIALSGTPSQVAGLIASSEDGLFSRFLFYVFKVEQKWKAVSPDANNINLTEYFKNLSKQVFQLTEFLEKEESSIDLSKKQWAILNNDFEEMLDEITLFTSEDAGSIVKRLGLILYRIAMIFTAMRKFENGESASKLVCTDEDFSTALELVKIYLKHSILMFNNLPKQSDLKTFKRDDSKRIFIDALPNEFTRKLAVEIGIKYQLSESTVSHLLPRLVGKYFTQIKAGHYKKVAAK